MVNICRLSEKLRYQASENVHWGMLKKREQNVVKKYGDKTLRNTSE